MTSRRFQVEDGLTWGLLLTRVLEQQFLCDELAQYEAWAIEHENDQIIPITDEDRLFRADDFHAGLAQELKVATCPDRLRGLTSIYDFLVLTGLERTIDDDGTYIWTPVLDIDCRALRNHEDPRRQWLTGRHRRA